MSASADTHQSLSDRLVAALRPFAATDARRFG